METIVKTVTKKTLGKNVRKESCSFAISETMICETAVRLMLLSLGFKMNKDGSRYTKWNTVVSMEVSEE